MLNSPAKVIMRTENTYRNLINEISFEQINFMVRIAEHWHQLDTAKSYCGAIQAIDGFFWRSQQAVKVPSWGPFQEMNVTSTCLDLKPSPPQTQASCVCKTLNTVMMMMMMMNMAKPTYLNLYKNVQSYERRELSLTLFFVFSSLQSDAFIWY